MGASQQTDVVPHIVLCACCLHICNQGLPKRAPTPGDPACCRVPRADEVVVLLSSLRRNPDLLRALGPGGQPTPGRSRSEAQALHNPSNAVNQLPQQSGNGLERSFTSMSERSDHSERSSITVPSVSERSFSTAAEGPRSERGGHRTPSEPFAASLADRQQVPSAAMLSPPPNPQSLQQAAAPSQARAWQPPRQASADQGARPVPTPLTGAALLSGHRRQHSGSSGSSLGPARVANGVAASNGAHGGAHSLMNTPEEPGRQQTQLGYRNPMFNQARTTMTFSLCSAPGLLPCQACLPPFCQAELCMAGALTFVIGQHSGHCSILQSVWLQLPAEPWQLCSNML